jgi:glucose/arabinose dehydrogenase
MKKIIFILFILSFSLNSWANIPLDKIKLPSGFHIEVYSDAVSQAREMAFSPSGVLYAGSWSGNVYAVLPPAKPGEHPAVKIVARGLQQPVGVAYFSNSLYISAVSKIYRLDNIDAQLDNPPKPVIVNDSYPTDTWHGWKFIRFGPDGRLYVPVGFPCNVCLPSDRRFGTITRINRDGSGFEIVASGVRNTVGFDWHPVTGELWFTENGRDYLGDDLPPDELNRVEKTGMNYGFPYVHGKSLDDPEFGKKKPDGFQYAPAEMELGPHVAALGMRFYTGSQFPPEYKNQIFIAEHGSWNRSIPIGYRITLVSLDRTGKHAVSYRVFAEGWLEGSSAWGRPADVEIGPNGSLYVSDDRAGAIYRIWYEKVK